MRVIWQSNADRQRDQIAEYIRQEFGADETIHIVAFWDTRMEPEEQAASVR